MTDKTQVFNRDCLEAMREFPDKFFELAIVDPPYGAADAINPKSSARVYAAKRGNYREFTNEMPDQEYFTELFRISKNTIVWGGNFFGLYGGVIAWNKYGTAFGEGEVAICSTHKSVRFFEFEWNGMIQQDMKNKEQRIHPTQKPVALYKWLLKNYAKEGDKILDTHLGSGSSRIAAFDGGFEFWGYELDSEYFAASEKRFQQHKSQLKLF
jgi:site-specific DNA-methyltransferase (adenine-specific)